MKGKIARLIAEKNFGFLKVEGSADVFFHKESLVNIKFDDLRVGQELEFDLEQGTKGPRAENITA